ncbi:PPE-repeat protein [Lentzea fradiae]|uniref:PPE-repeat protein n=1 Tax=Lentzea fradiae TaxID=200378 RepID=A0A1G7XTK8_9PSEU|nr:PPE domain-containing protein [Lentzea fradiae]SDG87517.1 PPE-repeat protein [Lentzea fradiae]
MALGSHNFDAQSHQQLYDKIHKSVDPSTAQAISDAWGNFPVVMGNAKSNLQSAIHAAGAVWIGAAGEQFAGATAPLVQWAEDARMAGVETHASFQRHQAKYLSTKVDMPKPVEVSSTANDDFFGIPAGLTHLVGGQTDQDVQEQQALDAKREAVRVMHNYDDTSLTVVNSLGAFTPPPEITTEVAEPAFDQPSAQRKISPTSFPPSATPTGEPDRGTTPQQQQQQQAGTPTSPAATVGTDTARDTTGTSTAQRPADVRPGPMPQLSPPASPTPGTAFQPPFSGPVPATSFARPTPAGSPASRGGGTGAGAGASRSGAPASGGARPGTTGLGGGLSGQPGQADRQAGRGPAAGVGSFGSDTGRGGASGTGVRGAAGGAGANGLAGAPHRGEGDEDTEHKTADYLEELRDIWGENDLPMVAPPVIGDDRS